MQKSSLLYSNKELAHFFHPSIILNACPCEDQSEGWSISHLSALSPPHWLLSLTAQASQAVTDNQLDILT